jgi:ubiquinone/menaquinone biosynthesis C-methylase UbiE
VGLDVVRVDLTQEAVDAAREAFVRHGVEGQFLLGDVRQPTFPDASFDFAYAGGVVEHFRESLRAVAEMAHVLRPGGRVLFTVRALTLSYPSALPNRRTTRRTSLVTGG